MTSPDLSRLEELLQIANASFKKALLSCEERHVKSCEEPMETQEKTKNFDIVKDLIDTSEAYSTLGYSILCDWPNEDLPYVRRYHLFSFLGLEAISNLCLMFLDGVKQNQVPDIEKIYRMIDNFPKKNWD